MPKSLSLRIAITAFLHTIVLTIAVLAVFIVFVIILGYLYSPTVPEAKTQELSIDTLLQSYLYNGISALEKNEIINSIFFLVLQTCGLFVVLYMSRFLDGRERVKQTAKNVIVKSVADANERISLATLRIEGLRKIKDIEEHEVRSYHSIELKSLEHNAPDEDKENSVQEKGLRDLIYEAIYHCTILENTCEYQKVYLDVLKIDGNIDHIRATSQEVRGYMIAASRKRLMKNLLLEWKDNVETNAKILNEVKLELN